MYLSKSMLRLLLVLAVGYVNVIVEAKTPILNEIELEMHYRKCIVVERLMEFERVVFF